MRKKDKKYDDDDGRVIANMNVDGMPWNNGYDRWFGGIYKKKYRRNIEEQQSQNVDDIEALNVTKKETRVLMFNALVATLLIGLVFALAAFLFIIFCLNVWFKY